MDKPRKFATPAAAPQTFQSAKAGPDPIEALKSIQPAERPFENMMASAMDPESDSWEQQHETILEFLRRLPVGNPATAEIGPWLWVRCPKELQDRGRPGNVEAFMQTAEPLLDRLLKKRKTFEQQNPGKAVGTITRKMGPYRDQLEIDLLNTATKHGLTSSKWLLFPVSDDLPLVWRLVAEATAAGKLGPCSKVGTWEPDHVTKPTVIVCTLTTSQILPTSREYWET